MNRGPCARLPQPAQCGSQPPGTSAPWRCLDCCQTHSCRRGPGGGNEQAPRRERGALRARPGSRPAAARAPLQVLRSGLAATACKQRRARVKGRPVAPRASPARAKAAPGPRAGCACRPPEHALRHAGARVLQVRVLVPPNVVHNRNRGLPHTRVLRQWREGARGQGECVCEGRGLQGARRRGGGASATGGGPSHAPVSTGECGDARNQRGPSRVQRARALH